MVAEDKSIADELLGSSSGGTGGKSDKIDFFGTKIDLFTAIIGILAGGAAIGTGYLFYNDMQKKTLAEKAQKEHEQLRQAQYMNYLREQEEQKQRMQRPAPQPAVPEEEEADEQNYSKVDMNMLQPVAPAPRSLSYSEILSQSEASNPGNPTAYNMNSPLTDYNATFPSRTRNIPAQPQEEVKGGPLIDMSRIVNNPNMEIQQPATPPPVTAQPQEEEQSEEVDALYKSMNNY